FRMAEKGLNNPDPRLPHIPPAIEAALRAALTPRPEARLPLKEFLGRLRVKGSQALGEGVLTWPFVPDAAPSGGPPTRLPGEVFVTPPREPVRTMPAETEPLVYRGLELVSVEAPCYRVPEGSGVCLRFHTHSGGNLLLLAVEGSGSGAILLPK